MVTILRSVCYTATYAIEKKNLSGYLQHYGERSNLGKGKFNYSGRSETRSNWVMQFTYRRKEMFRSLLLPFVETKGILNAGNNAFTCINRDMPCIKEKPKL